MNIKYKINEFAASVSYTQIIAVGYSGLAVALCIAERPLDLLIGGAIVAAVLCVIKSGLDK